MTVGLLSFVSAAPYLGPVATRAYVPNSHDTTNLQFNSRSWHFARQTITSLKVAFPNWYSNAEEGGVGGSGTLFASIEYPAGTFTRVTWNSGATSISIADATTAVSDFVSVSIPNGTAFYIRFFYTGTVAAPHETLNKDTTRGDALNIAASGLSDQTMSGTITDNTGDAVFPVAVLAMTTQPSVAIIGDSIALGLRDVADATGDVGSVARSIGGTFGYLNLACNGDTAQGFLGSPIPLRAALAQYASHVVIEYGQNDFFINHRSSAQLLSDMSGIIALFPTKKIILTTIGPNTTSTDNWATTINQTVLNGTDEASRVSYNTSVRAGISGAAHFSEIADVLESSRNSGLWAVTGVAQARTIDGVHPSPASYQLLIGTTNTAWFAYP